MEGAGADGRAREGAAPRGGRGAAKALGATFTCLDLGDYPLELDKDALGRLADVIREFGPDTLITHTDTDPFNPDHPVASR